MRRKAGATWDGGGVGRLAQNCGHQLSHRRPRERSRTRSKFVEQHAKRPDVTSRVGLRATQQFGGHRIRGAAGEPGIRRPCLHRGVTTSQPEVDHFDPACLRNQNIGGFQIPVHDVALVSVRKRAGDLHGQLQRECQRLRSFGDYIAERPPVDILHHDEAAVAMLRDFVDRADVGVIERRGRPGFIEEQPADVELIRWMDELDGDGALQARVEGAIDDAHAAGAQDVFDFIMPEPVVRSEQ